MGSRRRKQAGAFLWRNPRLPLTKLQELALGSSAPAQFFFYVHLAPAQKFCAPRRLPLNSLVVDILFPILLCSCKSYSNSIFSFVIFLTFFYRPTGTWAQQFEWQHPIRACEDQKFAKTRSVIQSTFWTTANRFWLVCRTQ